MTKIATTFIEDKQVTDSSTVYVVDEYHKDIMEIRDVASKMYYNGTRRGTIPRKGFSLPYPTKEEAEKYLTDF